MKLIKNGKTSVYAWKMVTSCSNLKMMQLSARTDSSTGGNKVGATIEDWTGILRISRYYFEKLMLPVFSPIILIVTWMREL